MGGLRKIIGTPLNATWLRACRCNRTWARGFVRVTLGGSLPVYGSFSLLGWWDMQGGLSSKTGDTRPSEERGRQSLSVCIGGLWKIGALICALEAQCPLPARPSPPDGQPSGLSVPGCPFRIS